MTRRVLLDTNLLIAALDEDGSTSEAERASAKQRLQQLATDENDVVLIITPLIRYEVLRGIGWEQDERFDSLKQALDGLTELDINEDISMLAAHLFRFERSENPEKTEKSLDKRKFDVFHLATAKCHQLELASQDSDIARLEDLYQRYIQQQTLSA